jgi:A/G-specific adenine glycosylase
MDNDYLAPPLLHWYRREHRDLPWRRTRDPYAIWISEVMLQQTQVETAIPYYERWLAKWPTVGSLAAASEEAVLKMWQGLGYYARARHLLAAAKLIESKHAGQFPRRFEEIRELPGIGRSTAGAIAALAWGDRQPILDGNVRRVLSRLTAEKGKPESAVTQRRLWKAAEKLLPAMPADNRDYANAIMELGATLCLPKNPACLFCPWNARCIANQRGAAADYPLAKAAKLRPHQHWLAYFLRRGDGAILAHRRESSGLWGGLWQLPTQEWPGRGLEKFISRDFAARRWGKPSAAVKSKAAVIEHAFTHFDLTLTVVRVPVRPGLLTAPLPAGSEWLSLRQFRAKPLPKPYVMLLDQLAQRKLKLA